ncbi:FecR family protein [Hymenobacter actinosclerus]|uniref:FecR family protein n=1 Tax=Hymenobacter actinosclerus TaxID=82805 RepID=A0A1I0FP49_9BACT|nr:FecR family protein [Hymenobacter actinosclerus]SET59083.1 FecR family protein [Hymenobacter actinosclerus]
MTDEEYLTLYERYYAGTATPAERARFEAYLAEAELPELPWREGPLGPPGPVRAAIWARLARSMRRPRSALRRRRRVLAAASLVLGLLGALAWWLPNQPASDAGPAPLAATRPAPPRLEPGRNQALLTLADGRTVRLADAGPGLLAQQGGRQVRQTAPGELSYQGAASNSAADSLLRNTVRTPRGGQYQLQLPDGSRVWLNADSRLAFPVAFGRRRRVVQLTGEAYFEVAKDAARPFEVEAGTARVTVLGTHFNVQAYPDEPAPVTTLLEGAVRLHQGAAQVLLRPGQQGRPRPDGTIAVRAVDASSAVAWKEGRFVFDDEPLEGIMRQVARWYDVQVRYEGQLSNKNFHGSISRFREASDVLHLLELTGAVHFTTEGRRITVRP